MPLKRLLPWGERNAERALRKIAKRRTPVMVEVEQHNLHFTTMLAVKGDAVVVARPRRFGRKIPVGAWLRVFHEDLPHAGFRMRVRTPLFLLRHGNTVIVADLPQQLTAASLRRSPRFDTSGYREVLLRTDGMEQPLRVLDVSGGGCRIALARRNAEMLLPLAEKLHRGTLRIGNHPIQLSTLVPVAHLDESVGVSFQVRNDDRSPAALQRILEKLAEINARRYRVDPAI